MFKHKKFNKKVLDLERSQKMNIIIFYQHIKRERDAILSIKTRLENFGYIVKCFSINYEYYKAIKFAKKMRINLIVMPWMYHEKNYELMAPFIKNNKKLIIVNLHSEEISSPFSSEILMPHDNNSKFSVYHFVWGEYFKNKLLNVGIPNKLIKITGNCRTDSILLQKQDKQKISKKYELDPRKKWILYSENRGWVYNWNDKLKKERMAVGKNERDLEEYLNLSRTALEKTYEDFNSLNDSFFSDFELIYRPHPGTICPVQLNKKIKIINDNSIYDWLSVVDVNVVWSSTTAFESDAMDVVTIVHESIDNIQKYKTAGIEYYFTIHTMNELSNDIINEAYSVQKKNKVYKKYLGNIEGNNCLNIAREIDNIFKDEINVQYASLVPINYKMIIRRCIFEKITWLFSKLNLIQKIKYPKSAFSDYKDIPWIFGKELMDK